MGFDPEKHHRRSIRLPGYDYTQAGAYFITICAHDRARLFGEVVDGEICLNGYGQILQAVWGDLPNHYPGVGLDAFVVMPNHVHGIVVLIDDVTAVGAGLKPAPTKKPAPTGNPTPTNPTPTGKSAPTGKPAPTIRRYGLSEIIRGFKTFSARRINEGRGTLGTAVWQRNYYEHIIRNESELGRIREYILSNPQQWEADREYRPL